MHRARTAACERAPTRKRCDRVAFASSLGNAVRFSQCATQLTLPVAGARCLSVCCTLLAGRSDSLHAVTIAGGQPVPALAGAAPPYSGRGWHQVMLVLVQVALRHFFKSTAAGCAALPAPGAFRDCAARTGASRRVPAKVMSDAGVAKAQPSGTSACALRAPGAWFAAAKARFPSHAVKRHGGGFLASPAGFRESCMHKVCTPRTVSLVPSL